MIGNVVKAIAITVGVTASVGAVIGGTAVLAEKGVNALWDYFDAKRKSSENVVKNGYEYIICDYTINSEADPA